MFVDPSIFFHFTVSNHVVRENNGTHSCKTCTTVLSIFPVPAKIIPVRPMPVSTEDTGKFSISLFRHIQTSGYKYSGKTFNGHIGYPVSVVSSLFCIPGLQRRF